MKLSVNIDHIATLRQVRGGIEPNLSQAITEVLEAGADGITVHLRKDLRHIQLADIEMIQSNFNIPLNVEFDAYTDLNSFLSRFKPAMITLVPENPNEVTTEGGLKLDSDTSSLGQTLASLREKQIHSSLFIDPKPILINRALTLNPDAIEINTNHYSLQTVGSKAYEEALSNIKECAHLIHNEGLRVLAGHGLNRFNVQDIAKISVVDELNIGHSIIARSIYVGLSRATQEILLHLR